MAAQEKTDRGNVFEAVSVDPAQPNPSLSHVGGLDTALLIAFQEYIIPLIHGLQHAPHCRDSSVCNPNDGILVVNSAPSRHEASKLLSALEAFVSCIASQSQAKYRNDGVDVDLPATSGNEGVQEDIVDDDIDSSSDNESLESQSNGSIEQDDLADSIQERAPVTMDRIMVALREHVFNAMPIRLLSFKPHDSKLQIKLLERGVIHGQIAVRLQTEITEDDFAPQINKVRRSTETDEEIIQRIILRYASYAILSHTWLRGAPGEVTYGNWHQGAFAEDDLGYLKLVNFCQVAWRDHGLTLGWMDTICINKESSAELDESIRSMYNWYRKSEVCITYLAESSILADMHTDPWFTRGWTLQELLAPRRLRFYDSHWKPLVEATSAQNDKWHPAIVQQINEATSITDLELRRNIADATISRRMQLAAKREVTREEDMAYSLMGIFNISISIAYGEGAERAFFRLLKEILSNSEDVLDVLNWGGDIPQVWTRVSGLLPISLKQYLQRSKNETVVLGRPIEPLTVTHLGLRVPFLLMPATSVQDKSAPDYTPFGDYYSTITITPVGYYKHPNPIPTTYNVLEKRVIAKDGKLAGSGRFQMSVGVLNFGADDARVRIRKTCFGIGIVCAEDAGSITTLGSFNRIFTEEPIVFDLKKKGVVDTGPDADQIVRYLGNEYYYIKRSRLARHGMQLVTLYL